MIDFRYHLVSLMSVFIALAVGIVLGAGPLQAQLVDSLRTQVESLRSDRNALKAERDSAEAGVADRDSFATAVAPTLVGQQLTGRSVVLVTLPSIDGDAVKPLTQTLQLAGAQVTGRIDVKSAWTAPDSAQVRQRLADRWRGALSTARDEASAVSASPATSSGPTPTRSTASPSPTAPPTSSSAAPSDSTATLEAELARAVLTTSLAQRPAPDATSVQILDALGKAGLVNVNGDFTARATIAVLLVPGVESATVAGALTTQTGSPARDDTGTWAELSAALDRAGDGAVVVGPASSATTGGVVAAVRSTANVTKLVSTVDTGGTPMGDITTVFALREQLAGQAGAYGYGKSATAPLPGQPGSP